jgi:hypothetical protein
MLSLWQGHCLCGWLRAELLHLATLLLVLFFIAWPWGLAVSRLLYGWLQWQLVMLCFIACAHLWCNAVLLGPGKWWCLGGGVTAGWGGCMMGEGTWWCCSSLHDHGEW